MRAIGIGSLSRRSRRPSRGSSPSSRSSTSTCTAAAADEQFALDVSSPGLDRPLRTVAQFARATGQRVYVKTDPRLDGRAVFRGRLTGSGAEVVTLTLDEGAAVDIPFHTIAKAHVIFEFDDNGGHQ